MDKPSALLFAKYQREHERQRHSNAGIISDFMMCFDKDCIRRTALIKWLRLPA